MVILAVLVAIGGWCYAAVMAIRSGKKGERIVGISMLSILAFFVIAAGWTIYELASHPIFSCGCAGSGP